MILKWTDVLNLAKAGNPAPDRKVVKTDAEWRAQLSDEEYHVTRQAGTERAFSSEMCSLFEPGIYSCLCCETVLFDASEKFESHTAWLSFTQPIKENDIAYRFDGPAFLKRVECICNTCDAHLGHTAFEALGCFRPDVAFLRAALGFPATLGLSGLRAAQIRVTATLRDSNFLTGFTSGSLL